MKDHNLFSIIPYKDHLIQLENPARAIAYYKNHAVNLLTGEKFPHDFSHWILKLKKKTLLSFEENPRVIHLFYELGFIIENEFQSIDEETLLVIDIEFQHFKKITQKSFKKIHLNLESFPRLEEYKKTYDLGYEDLLKGNCYQFNLTCPFIYSFDADYSPFDFIFSLWRNPLLRGRYASATYIPFYKKLFLSNSPECLFQLKDQVLSTYPIKGTIKREENEDWKKLWAYLKQDKKSQAELFMISDLLRNDLSKIEKPEARVVRKKFPQLVPGLLHQCAQVDVRLGPQVSLWQIMANVYPGGSITGAPKLRAMRLIARLELRQRGFYCGSTMILFKQMKSASINIRSSAIEFNQNGGHLTYQAGGGVTLLSRVEEEYKEMTYKVESYINTLTL